MPALRGPNKFGDVITQLADLQSTTGGITDKSSLEKTFGVDPNLVGNIFGARKRQLASGRARALSSASARMSTRAATPEVAFGGIESGFADASSNLGAAQGQAELSQQQSLMQMLYNILQGNNQFNLQKNQLQTQALGGQLQEQQYEDSKPGFFDDLMSVLSFGTQAAGAAGGLGWAPFASGKKG